MESLLRQTTTSTGGGGAIVILLVIYVAIIVLMIAAFWKIFTKAGQPGWASIIPFYNLYILLKVVGRPAWWLIMFLIPFVNIVFLIIVYVDLAKAFGKGAGYAVGMLLLPFIFFPILGFGSATYQGSPHQLAGGYGAPGGAPGYPPPPAYPPR